MNTTGWKHFKLEELFEIYTPKGVNLLESEQGKTHYVSSTQNNNGVASYVSQEPINSANTITIARNGSVCSAFYHPYDYNASPDDVRVLKPKFKMNKYSALFICTLIEKEKFRYTYGRKFGTNRMKETKIKLPVNSKDDLDLNRIEHYIKTLKVTPKTSAILNEKFDVRPLLDKKLNLNTNEWRWFNIKDIFTLQKCKCSNATELLEVGTDINYIGAKKSENGLMQTVRLVPELVTKGNCILFIGDGQGSVGYTTYQPVDFIGSTTLTAGYSYSLNKYNAQFLISVLDMERFRYSFGRKYGYSIVSKSKIKLPVASNGEPDWQFMEDYIKSLPYSSCI
jgi:hypothetical protein